MVSSAAAFAGGLLGGSYAWLRGHHIGFYTASIAVNWAVGSTAYICTYLTMLRAVVSCAAVVRHLVDAPKLSPNELVTSTLAGAMTGGLLTTLASNAKRGLQATVVCGVVAGGIQYGLLWLEAWKVAQAHHILQRRSWTRDLTSEELLEFER